MTSKSELNQFVGKTAMLAQYLEIELGTILLVQEANKNRWFESPIDSAKAYEKLREQVNKNMLGASLRKLKENINYQDDLVLIMNDALEARNRFTHHIFREHGLGIHSEEGRSKFIADVNDLNKRMQRAYDIAQPIAAALVMEHMARVKEPP